MTRLSRLSRSVAGQVALVTGAASGMGRATAHLFADEGARVGVADRDSEGARRVADEISESGGEALALSLDVASAPSVEAAIAQLVDGFGRLDILVNNAGVSIPAPIGKEAFDEAWDLTLAVNLTGHARTVRAALPHLLASGAGRVVNIASTEGLGASAGVPAYTASKHGVIGLTRSLAVELGSQGITINCVCPGPINTGMTALIPDDAKRKFARRRVPLRRYGDPEEVAHCILSLCLPAASYANGAVLVVDGGLTSQNT